MNRQLIGWIVAGVLAIALGGVVIYEATNDSAGDSRSAALSSEGQRDLPTQVGNDFSQVRDEKQTEGKNALPELGEGQEPTNLQSNPAPRCNPNDEPNVFVEWRNNPQNLEEAAAAADTIVVGTVVGAAMATPFSANVAGEPNNPQQVPIQNVTVRVNDSVKGEAGAGTTVTVQRLGDAAGCFRVAGDAPYQRGQQYLLLLEDGAGNRPPHTISPEGRYMVRANGTLQAGDENEFGEDLDGDRLQAVVQQLE